MEVTIEKLRKEDLKEAISIYDENHNLTTDYDKLINIYDKIYNNSAYHNIVAKVNGKIVGLATVITNYDIVEELKPFLTVWNFGVKEEYRRQKIGTNKGQLTYIFGSIWTYQYDDFRHIKLLMVYRCVCFFIGLLALA